MINAAAEAMHTRTKRLLRAGFNLVPLGRGDDGKAPLISKWQCAPLGPDDFTRRMQETQSTMYGVRLDGMIVLDCDVHDDALVKELEQRFGNATVKVQTPRGVHLYYRHDRGELPTVVGLPVDVKWGNKHYVVGAGSLRPCGGRYVPLCGDLGVTALTPLHDQDPLPPARYSLHMAPARSRATVSKGMRHNFLVCRAVCFAPMCESEAELIENLIFARDEECEEPSTVSDKEVRDIAKWVFEKAQSGRLYAASGGSFRISRHFAVTLRRDAEAAALLVLLTEQHGHHPHKVFDLNYAAMKREGLTGLSQRAFKRALKTLMSAGAVIIAKNYQVGQRSRRYSLGQPPA